MVIAWVLLSAHVSFRGSPMFHLSVILVPIMLAKSDLQCIIRLDSQAVRITVICHHCKACCIITLSCFICAFDARVLPCPCRAQKPDFPSRVRGYIKGHRHLNLRTCDDLLLCHLEAMSQPIAALKTSSNAQQPNWPLNKCMGFGKLWFGSDDAMSASSGGPL